jgi:hypothetical protein
MKPRPFCAPLTAGPSRSRQEIFDHHEYLPGPQIGSVRDWAFEGPHSRRGTREPMPLTSDADTFPAMAWADPSPSSGFKIGVSRSNHDFRICHCSLAPQISSRQ